SELREDAKREGMTGISTRSIMKALDNALSDNVEGNCINPINVREALISMVKEADLPDDTRKQHLEFLQDVLHKEYLELLEKEITKAFVYSYQEQAEALFQNYLDHAEAFVNKTRVKDRNTKEELQPDEGFLKSIEEQIAIIGSAAEGFRQELMAYLWASGRAAERSSYRPSGRSREPSKKKSITWVAASSAISPKPGSGAEDRPKKTSRTSSQRSRSSGRTARRSSRSPSAASASTSSSTARTPPVSARGTASRRPGRWSARRSRPARARTRPATSPAATTTRPTSPSRS